MCIRDRPTTFHFSAVSKTFFPQIPDFDQNADKTGALLAHYLNRNFYFYYLWWCVTEVVGSNESPTTIQSIHRTVYTSSGSNVLLLLQRKKRLSHNSTQSTLKLCHYMLWACWSWRKNQQNDSVSIMKTAIIIGLRTELTWPFQHILINKNYFVVKNAWCALCTF